MRQLALLWEYMQADMAAERFEAQMRQSPARQTLLKHRNFLMEQQSNMKKIEGDLSAMGDRLEAVRDEAQRLDGVVSDAHAAMDLSAEDTLDDLKKSVSALQKTLGTLTRYEQEIQKLIKDSDTRDRQQKEIRLRAARVKAEFDQIKTQYDIELKDQNEQLTALKAAAESRTVGIDPAMFAKYKDIRSHVIPPMAHLDEERCGVCHMSLPSVVMREIRAGNTIVECDNCGRILYIPE